MPRPHRTMMTSDRAIANRLIDDGGEELSALPIWTFTLGVFAILTFGLTAVPSIICGHVALARDRGNARSSLARSVALIGLLIGYVGAAVLGTWLIVLARYLSA